MVETAGVTQLGAGGGDRGNRGRPSGVWAVQGLFHTAHDRVVVLSLKTCGEIIMDQLCPKCATGTCPYRDGIFCRAKVCALEHPEIMPGLEGLLKAMGQDLFDFLKGAAK